MSALNELSATDTVGQIRAGEITAEAVMRDCLQRVSEREKTIKAWAYLNEDQALESARLVDNNEQKGPLAGLPVGIKDVLDTADMPTQMGSPIYRGWQPMVDSATVSLMRNAGAVIMGKTVTCEFAGLTQVRQGILATPIIHQEAHQVGQQQRLQIKWYILPLEPRQGDRCSDQRPSVEFSDTSQPITSSIDLGFFLLLKTWIP